MMFLIEIIVYLFVFAAVSVVLATGSIFESMKYLVARKVPPALEEVVLSFLFCPMCLGFWIGLGGSFVKDPTWVGTHSPWDNILSAFAVSVTAAIIGRITYHEHKEG